MADFIKKSGFQIEICTMIIIVQFQSDRIRTARLVIRFNLDYAIWFVSPYHLSLIYSVYKITPKLKNKNKVENSKLLLFRLFLHLLQRVVVWVHSWLPREDFVVQPWAGGSTAIPRSASSHCFRFRSRHRRKRSHQSQRRGTESRG